MGDISDPKKIAKKGINVKKPTQKLTSTPTIDTAQIEEMFDSTHP